MYQNPSGIPDTGKASLNYGDATAVFQIPRALWDRAHRENPGAECCGEEVGLDDGLGLKPDFYVGWIDRINDRFHPRD